MSYKRFVHNIFIITKSLGIPSDHVGFINEGNIYRAKAKGIYFNTNGKKTTITVNWGDHHTSEIAAV